MTGAALAVAGLALTPAALQADRATAGAAERRTASPAVRVVGRLAAGWVAAWSASLAPPEPTGRSHAGFYDVTLREIVRLSTDGAAVRIRLANTYGSRPVVFDAVTVGRRGVGAAVAGGTLRWVTFAGRRSVTVPVGAEAVSDPAGLRVSAFADLAVSVHIAGGSGPATWHPVARTTSYLAFGDHVADRRTGAFTGRTSSWWFLAGVDVPDRRRAGAVVALGDSITDGSGSRADANRRWPDLLARRLQALPAAARPAILDAGLSGNRMLGMTAPSNGLSALQRLRLDVLATPGARYVVVLEGVNDLRHGPVTAGALEDGYREIVARAHAGGLVVIGGTILPFGGGSRWSPAREAAREQVNAWIRGSGVFDGVIDFDQALRNPDHPKRLLRAYDSGDHLHPGDRGYAAMAAAVDLGLFHAGG